MTDNLLLAQGYDVSGGAIDVDTAYAQSGTQARVKVVVSDHCQRWWNVGGIRAILCGIRWQNIYPSL